MSSERGVFDCVVLFRNGYNDRVFTSFGKINIKI